ncbi:MAG: carbohydrate kinase family protein [Chloroflexota bacterium]
MTDDIADIVVVGAACLDVKGRLMGDIVAGTSNPGMVQISVGGCARNIAENLARLGLSTALLTVVCQDDFGRTIVHQTEGAGVNTDHVLITCDQHSAAYIALLNPQGNLLVGLDDTEATVAITPDYIDTHASLLTNARMVMIDANVPIESAKRLLDICSIAGVPVGLDPVAFAPAQRYRQHIGAFALVTPNAVEAQALTGMPISDVDQAIRAAKQLITQGVEIAIITMANQGLVYATSDSSGHIPAVSMEIVDATGASDALTSTVLYALINEISIDEAVRLGASAAALTLSSPETVRQDLSLESLYEQLVL